MLLLYFGPQNALATALMVFRDKGSSESTMLQLCERTISFFFKGEIFLYVSDSFLDSASPFTINYGLMCSAKPANKGPCVEWLKTINANDWGEITLPIRTCPIAIRPR